MMSGHFDYVSRKTQGKSLICIQDTTEYNYNHHRGIIREGELGTISDNQSLGLRVHPMLVLDAEDHFPYGFSSLQTINRAGKSADKYERSYWGLPIEEKESYRWIKSVEQTKQRLKGAKHLTIVADRESDIYQLWSRVPDDRTHLVVRTPFSRKFLDEDNEEITTSNPLESLGSYQIYLPARPEKRGKARTVTLEVACRKAFTMKPRSLKSQRSNSDPEKIPLTIVMAKEVVPDGATVETPIEWVLLTDKTVDTLEQAMEIIDIYKSRWNIEQVFRLTKHKGFHLEESQLETAHALENMIALVFIAATRIFQMVKCRDNQIREPTDVFEDQQVVILAKICPNVEGRTERSKNKNKPHTLAYYIWVVARLGGWKPEDRDPPGPVTLKRGWDILTNYINIAQMAKPPS